ncbi:hypothetical protein LCGC14_2749290 [marine sediment metagenome]|uniref:Uncharacterized protein n=1 Tax=marine sediment metagenome TaxID=412755 RepID=A0A0F8Z256_9ZZZZ
MTNVKTYLGILIFMDLMFIITGQIAATSPTSVITNAILDPSNITTSSFWLILFGVTGIGALATLIGFATGIVSRSGVNVLAFVAIAVGLGVLIGDFVAIFIYLADLSLIGATITMVPLIVLFGLTVIEWLKSRGFNIRLSINLTDLYDDKSPKEIFDRLNELNVDQVTFRRLFKSGKNTKQDKWIDEHDMVKEEFDELPYYIKENGRQLERLPFGAMKYSIHGMSVVVDDDCMSTEVKDVMKYLILRENGKLYSKWDDTGSLIF